MKVLSLVLLSLFIGSTTYAAGPAASPPPSATADNSAEAGESVDVSKITEKYWAQGKETELGVVQNRKYTSAGKIELEGFFGTLSSDPFLSVHHYGGSLGYHFNQYFSLHAIAWKASASGSDALSTFQALPGSPIVNTNMPKGFYGLQGNYNFLYGKASLFGKVIIYVDLFVLGGMGVTDTESGKNVTPFFGLGQKIHLNKFLALTLDYRIMRYNETILSKQTATAGQFVSERSNTTDAVTLGLSLFY